MSTPEDERAAEIAGRWADLPPAPWTAGIDGMAGRWAVAASDGNTVATFGVPPTDRVIERGDVPRTLDAVAYAPYDVAWLLAERARLAAEADHLRAMLNGPPPR
jgi:hypothetical protein